MEQLRCPGSISVMLPSVTNSKICSEMNKLSGLKNYLHLYESFIQCYKCIRGIVHQTLFLQLECFLLEHFPMNKYLWEAPFMKSSSYFNSFKVGRDWNPNTSRCSMLWTFDWLTNCLAHKGNSLQSFYYFLYKDIFNLQTRLRLFAFDFVKFNLLLTIETFLLLSVENCMTLSSVSISVSSL